VGKPYHNFSQNRWAEVLSINKKGLTPKSIGISPIINLFHSSIVVIARAPKKPSQN
jgi:hypothetical protein